MILFTFQGNSTVNGGANNYLCASNIRLAANQEGTFFCKPTASGRYVYIRNPGNSKVVIVCEVEVYSTYLTSKFSFNNCVVIIVQGINGSLEKLVCRGETLTK